MPLPIKPIRNVDDVERLAESGMQKVGEVGQKTVEQTAQQAEDTSRAFIDQLYGASEQDPQEVGTEQPGSSQKSQTQHQGDSSSSKSPTEQAQIEATRKQLEMLQGGNYNTQFSAEASLQRYRAKQREEEEKKRQEEEEKAQAEEERAQQMQSEAVMPTGKHTGTPNAPRPKVALEREKTKTESNRGSTG